MKKYFVFIVLVFLSLAVPVRMHAQESKKYNSTFIPQKYINDTSRTTLVMLTASWCGPCKAMKQSVMTDTKVQEVLSQMNVLYIDVDSNDGKIYSERFKIAGYEGSIPFFAILDTSGNVISSSTGYMKVDKFRRFLSNTD